MSEPTKNSMELENQIGYLENVIELLRITKGNAENRIDSGVDIPFSEVRALSDLVNSFDRILFPDGDDNDDFDKEFDAENS